MGAHRGRSPDHGERSGRERERQRERVKVCTGVAQGKLFPETTYWEKERG